MQAAPGATTATRAVSASGRVDTVRTFALSRAVGHVAVHWRGHPKAHVKVALSRGDTFGRWQRVHLDETGIGARRGETYGAVMTVSRARAVRVSSNVPIRRLSVVGFVDGGSPAPQLRPLRTSLLSATSTSAGVAQPSVIPRSGWGADESLRFDSTGKEVWPPAFYPVQKVIVHHTATQNSDPNPAATMRSIYYYHAITQGWGDIGYNFAISESGLIYEGRYSRPYAPGESPTGQDSSGNGVTAAHVAGYNSGTVGIALLGTLTSRDATPAARTALEKLIAWIDDSHGIDPQGNALFTNPVSGVQATFSNIAGHRDLAATECPGGVFYATLPALRADVASLIAATNPDFSLAASPASESVVQGTSAAYSIAVTRTGGFTGPVTLSAQGLPAGATATFTPNPADASTLTVTTSASTPTGTYPLTITGTAGAVTHSTSVTLVVTASPPPPIPSFTLGASPTTRTVVRGSSTTYGITVTPSGGFSAPVTFAVSGVPANATAAFSPNPAATSSTLTVRTTRTTKAGTFTLLITGAAGGLSRTTSVTLRVRRN